MKTRLLTLTFAALCSLLFSSNAAAQGCALTLTPHYSQYVSRSLDSSNNIYQHVELDGYADVGISASCHMSTAIHHPSIYNTIGSQGGSSSGPGACASCYVSYSTTVNFPGVPGIEYVVSADSSMVCTLAGTFWGVSSDGWIRIAVSNYLYGGTSFSVCTYNLYCTSGYASCGYPTIGVDAPCPSNYFVARYLVFRIGVNSTCFPVSIGNFSATPVPCS